MLLNTFRGSTVTAVSQITRARLEMQGYVGYSDHALAEFGPWTRLSPAVCATWALVATLLASAPAFWLLLPLSLLSVLLPVPPLDLLHNHLLRHRLGTGPIPPSGAPRRFTCLLASIWIVLTALAFAGGLAELGLILGFIMAAIASVPALTYFCIPSFIFGLLVGRPAGASCTLRDAFG